MGNRIGTEISLLQFPSHSDCTQCELHEGVTNVGIATGHYDQSVFPSPEHDYLIVIGMNPGYHEDRSNKHFVGPAGQLLKSAYLTPLNILKTHVVYLTNAARCTTPGDTELKRSHVKSCLPHTVADVDKIRQWHTGKGSILALGSHAIQAASKKWGGKTLSISAAREGHQGSLCSNDMTLFYTYHPAAVIRRRQLQFAVADDLELISQQLRGEIPTPSRPLIVSPRMPRGIT